MMDNSNKIIVDLCGGTGAWSDPYKKANYTVYVITLPNYDVTDYVIKNGYIIFFSQVIGVPNLHIKMSNIYGILAAPPCTMFSFARTTAKTPRNLKEGMETVIPCLNIIWHCQYQNILKFWAIENPARGYLRQFLGKPALTFHPYHFGNRWAKGTALWGYFKNPKKNPINLNQKELDLMRQNNRKLPVISCTNNGSLSQRRAITPSGFANAFFKANQ